ncbi:MAG: HAD family hydrolase [bacterium]
MKESWTEKIKAVGFDLDGTLYHSTPDMTEWIAKKLVQKVADFVGKEYDEVEEEYLTRQEKFRGNTLTLNSFGLDGEEVFQKLFDEVPMEKYIEREEGLAKMMERLEKRYKLFIISNGTRRQIVKKVKYMGLETKMFNPLIACYDHEGWMKPQPAAFLAALEQLALIPDEVVYVGDRRSTDIEGAKGVGMRAVLIGGESEVADASIESVFEIEALLVRKE